MNYAEWLRLVPITLIGLEFDEERSSESIMFAISIQQHEEVDCTGLTLSNSDCWQVDSVPIGTSDCATLAQHQLEQQLQTELCSRSVCAPTMLSIAILESSE